jgi:hypothetical protein
MDEYEVMVRYAGSLIDILFITALSDSLAKAYAFKRTEKLCGKKYAKACTYEIKK